jgi:8-oxo-dGTP diphosphatase
MELSRTEPARHVVSVDIVCLTVRLHKLQVLLVQRDRPPFAGDFALPGATVHELEPLDTAARRVMEERVGLEPTYLEQLYTFDGIADPRGPRMSVGFFSLIPFSIDLDKLPANQMWISVESLPPLPFDHALIIHYARNRLRQKLTYAPVAFKLLPEFFTISDLRDIHQAIEGREYNNLTNFQTNMLRHWTLVRTSELSHTSKRPARLYRYGGTHEVEGPPRLPERTLA